jgi:hypothetical protein
LPENPTELAIDAEQWRRDIQTFAETTSQVLNAIAAELSNECSHGDPFPKTILNNPNEHRIAKNGKASSIVATESPINERLARLKSQLAKQMQKTNDRQ